MSILSVVTSLVLAVAPKFLKNLDNRDPKKAEMFAGRIKNFVDTNVKPINTEADVVEVVKIIKEKPEINLKILDVLLDAERELAELHIADVQHARASHRDLDQRTQPGMLIGASFASIIFIGAAITYLAINPPSGVSGGERDIAIQLTGAAVGFLTGIGGMFARNISSACDFWYGSSMGSKSKTDQISQIIDEGAGNRAAQHNNPVTPPILNVPPVAAPPAPVIDPVVAARENFRALMNPST